MSLPELGRQVSFNSHKNISNKEAQMNIEIVTTPNEELKESGFGSLKACTSVLESLRKSGYSANLSVCQNMDDLD
jgi:hypothetical protein